MVKLILDGYKLEDKVAIKLFSDIIERLKKDWIGKNVVYAMKVK